VVLTARDSLKAHPTTNFHHFATTSPNRHNDTGALANTHTLTHYPQIAHTAIENKNEGRMHEISFGKKPKMAPKTHLFKQVSGFQTPPPTPSEFVGVSGTYIENLHENFSELSRRFGIDFISKFLLERYIIEEKPTLHVHGQKGHIDAHDQTPTHLPRHN
jgi:hypothetical protein